MPMRKKYKKTRFIAFLFFATLLAFPGVAQQRQISGIVKDDTGAAIPGVNVLLKGTSNGTNTDSDGKFSINISDESAVLVISFIGFTTQEISVANRTTIDVGLTPDVKSLQEVVVTGYASERKQDIVSAISTLSAARTVAVPVPNVEQALQGRVAGVTVFTSGQPGAPSQVRIRGFGSLRHNN